ncbi:MAG: spore gernimation protein [Paenibacillus sp.]|jgi:spore germination protein KB|nr:spore gernimation protein [Paenibacillus sp.]
MTVISPYQLFALTVLFQFGTTVIFGFASGSGRDAWLTASLSSILGAALIAVYVVITKLNGYDSLVGWYRKRFGRWLGTPLAWLYPQLFIYDAARGISDLKFLVPLTILPKTPPWFFTAAFILVVVYVLYAGIEVLCRIAGVLLPVLILFILLESVLLWASGSLHSDYLKPMLGEGFGRVGEQIWPIGITQTYGESIEMAVFWFMLNKRGHLLKISLGATLFASFFIVLFDLLAITALGEHIFKEMIFPAFTILKLSSIADFLENLDALGALYFMCTAFIKISVHMIAAVLCIRELTAASGDSIAIWITAVSVYTVAMTMAGNFYEHLQAGMEQLQDAVWVPMFIILPMLVLVLSLFEKMFKRRKAA